MHREKHPDKSYRDILWPILLFALLGICYTFTTQIIWKQAILDCYQEIEVATGRASAALRSCLQNNEEKLELIVGQFPEDPQEDIREVTNTLNALCSSRHMDALCLQFPDGQILSVGETGPDYSVLPSFESAKNTIPCISDRFPSENAETGWYIYQAVPVLKDGETTAILYGFQNLNSLPEYLANDMAYGGNSQYCIVDGNTGDYLMDMWHSSLGNLYDGNLDSRKAKAGYDYETMLLDISTGKSGYFVYLSEATGEYFYTRYQPIGINNWSIQLTVLESVAFANATATNKTIVGMGLAVMGMTLIYVIAMFFQHNRRLNRRQMQIKQNTFMFEVQQILFDAHQRPEMIEVALEKVGKTLEAEGILLLSLHNSRIHHTTVWRDITAEFKDVSLGENLKSSFPHVYQYLQQNKSLLYYIDQANNEFPEFELSLLRDRHIRSMMLVPVLDSHGVLQGVICAVNLQKRWDDCRYLECVVHSFMITIKNIRFYQIIHDMGAIDTLTGLKSRNSYEAELADYYKGIDESGNLSCIFIDVNGLHEINNRLGHHAGDLMLCTVANLIRDLFGFAHSYRIGGDEFVIFSHEEEEKLSERIKELRISVEESGYYISAGLASQRENEINITHLISQAEDMMYAEKKAFYNQNIHLGNIRGKNSELEKLLQEKQDSDNFLSLISSYFKGVFIVNLFTDTARIIYIPDYFSEALEKNGYRYFRSFQQYIEELVHPDDRQALKTFCNYTHIKQELAAGHSLRLRYRKVDQTIISVQIFASKNYEHSSETFWLFEQINI